MAKFSNVASNFNINKYFFGVTNDQIIIMIKEHKAKNFFDSGVNILPECKITQPNSNYFLLI